MWKNRHDYSKKDDLGRWINTEFPPDSFNRFPSNSGYRTSNREMLFYQYGVLYYDMRIRYQDKDMILYADDECCVTDMERNEISEYYPTANDLIKNFRFTDGKTLIDVVDDKNFYIDILDI